MELSSDGSATAQVVVRAGEEEYTAVARGDLAREANKLLANTPVKIVGELVKYAWRTEDGWQHEVLTIEINTIEPTR